MYLHGKPAKLGNDGTRLESDVVDEDAAEEVESETPAAQQDVVRHRGTHAAAQEGSRGSDLDRFEVCFTVLGRTIIVKITLSLASTGCFNSLSALSGLGYYGFWVYHCLDKFASPDGNLAAR